jgi:hypothetical protein
VQAYRKLIQQSACEILGEQGKFQKNVFLYVVRALPEFNRDKLQAQFDALPAELQGKVDWEQL